MNKFLKQQRDTRFENTCQHKIRFRSFHRAYNALKNDFHYITCSNLVIYKCKFCRGWHIGHKTK